MKRIVTGGVCLLVFTGCSLVAKGQQPGRIKASAIQVEMIQSDEIKLPAEFQVALYEKLIQQLEKRGGVQHVYRDGDNTASNVADLIVLHSTVRASKPAARGLDR
jgi:ATP:corrinoid adenosyltransferase